MNKLTLITILLVLNFGVFSQTTERRSLEFNVSVVQIDTITSELKVKLKIINNGKSSIVIDKNGILYSTKFGRIGKKQPNGGTSNGDVRVSIAEVAQPYEGNYIMLKPKESFETTHVFRLDDSFFEANRKYTFSASYGQFFRVKFEGNLVWKGVIDSNKINFQM